MRVLLVEDHDDLRTLLRCHLEQIGFATDAVERGEDALAAAAANDYDAILIDLGLPDLDGLEVIRRLRGGIAPFVPILVLTARHSVDDRVLGLDAGADDYLSKPFDLLELDARLRSITRRTERRRDRSIGFGGLRLDLSSREVFQNETLLNLTRRELALIEELMRGSGHTVVRDVLEDRIYGLDDAVSGNALEATVSRLRRRLGQAGASVSIEAVRGIGYRLVSLAEPLDDAGLPRQLPIGSFTGAGPARRAGDGP